eukprot:1091912-Rhodomonas_salina.1
MGLVFSAFVAHVLKVSCPAKSITFVRALRTVCTGNALVCGMPCLVLTQCAVLCCVRCYGVWGTEVAYGAVLCLVLRQGIMLPGNVCGTETGYAGTKGCSTEIEYGGTRR